MDKGTNTHTHKKHVTVKPVNTDIHHFYYVRTVALQKVNVNTSWQQIWCKYLCHSVLFFHNNNTDGSVARWKLLNTKHVLT